MTLHLPSAETGATQMTRARATNLPTPIVGHAMQLAAAVRDYDGETVRLLLEKKDRLPALAVALAAMVDIDRTPTELLAWNDDQEATPLMPHGTHAAFNRHKKRGDDPCDECLLGERRYQRLRSRRVRTKKAS